MLDTADLVAISAKEHLLVQATPGLVPGLWELCQESAASFGALADVVEVSAPPDVPDLYERSLATNLFFRLARRSASFELLEIARRHVPEAHAKRRRTLDLLAHAWIAWNAPNAARVWVLGERSNKKAYLRVFGNRPIESALKELNPKLSEWHKKLSARVHPGVHSAAGAVQPLQGTEMFRVSFFDSGADEGTEHTPAAVAYHLFEAAFTNIEAQQTFARNAFKGRSVSVPAELSAALASMVARHTELRNLWTSRVDAWREYRRARLKAIE